MSSTRLQRFLPRDLQRVDRLTGPLKRVGSKFHIRFRINGV